MMRRFFIRLNNSMVRLRRVRVAPGNLLLLLPHCLQNDGCERKVTDDLGRCDRCGKCRVSALVQLCEEFGIQGHLVGGGRRALEKVRQPGIRAVIAVACEKELCQGIRAAFPKPVLAVSNDCPNGPCRDTLVAVDAVRAAILELLDRSPRPV